MILYGKEIADGILDKLKETIKEKQLKIKLAVVLVGDNRSSEIYVAKKGEAAKRVGIDFELFKFKKDIEEEVLKNEIKNIVKNESISAIVIQLPLPEKFNVEGIMKLIPDAKDAESISPVVCAVDHILKEYGISLVDKKIVLIGSGILVGEPVGKWLNDQGLSFSGINDIGSADVVISGAGKKNLITSNMVKDGVILIDVGGDADFENIKDKALHITPVIGGVGPVTVACLLKNLVETK